MGIFRNFFGWLFASRWRIIGAIILIVALGYFGTRTFGKKSNQVQYQTAQAQTGTLVSSVSASGVISAGSSVDVTTQASGVVTEVYVKDGDTVTQGQKLAEVQLDQAAQAKQASALASLTSAQTAFLNAQNTQRSAQASLDKVLDDIHQFQYGNGGFANIGSANETQTQRQNRTSAEVAKDNAVNSVNSAAAQLNSASLAYQQLSPTIIAPTSGTVGDLTLTPGLVVSGGTTNSSNISTTPQKVGIVTLPNGQVQATADVSEIDITKVKVGQKVTMTMDAFPDQTFTGRVETIDTTGTVNSGVTTYTVTIAFDSQNAQMYPNMAVSANIITKINDNVLMVPSAAIQTTNGQSIVRVLRNGQPQTVDVTTGDSNDTDTVITSGLNAGDTVVTGTTGGSTTPTGATTSPFGGGGGFRFGGGGFGGGGGGVRVQTGGGRGG
jgi:macrolide-specific efflux system membrane fusion protein